VHEKQAIRRVALTDYDVAGPDLHGPQTSVKRVERRFIGAGEDRQPGEEGRLRAAGRSGNRPIVVPG
jgi:hypothetical protein